MRRFIVVLFWASVAVSGYFAIVPAPTPPVTGLWIDKIQHMTAFLTMTLLGGLAYRGQLPKLGLGLIAFGALIEIVQMIPVLNRDAEIGDFVADVFALSVGLAILKSVDKTRFRRKQSVRQM